MLTRIFKLKKVSIITPAYNRLDLLDRLYKSLTNQESKDFVWYFIDDGSGENLEEYINSKFNEGIIEIVYKRQNNGGKHTAVNLGVAIAQEEIVFILDNDDILPPNCIKRVIEEFEKIKDDASICGISFLRGCLDGKLIGKEYPSGRSVDTFANMRYNKNVTGDKFESFKTEIIKQFPFPQIDGEKFISEAVVWAKMSGEYKFVFVNDVLYLTEYQPDGLTSNNRRLNATNPKGAALVYKQLSTKQFKLKLRVKYTLAYIAHALIAKNKKIISNASSKFLCCVLMPFGYLVKMRLKKYAKKT